MALAMTYDTGALTAAEQNNDRLWALHEAALAAGVAITVPAGVLALAWRGGPQASLAQLLRGCAIEPLGEARARAVGALRARYPTSDLIDVSMILGAGIRGDAVVTANRDDIENLTTALGIPLVIIDI